MFKIDELVKATRGRLVRQAGAQVVKGVSIDSRLIIRGGVFIAIRGKNFDGHDFVQEAIRKQAAVIIFESPRIKLPGSGTVSFIKVENTIKALGDIARFHRNRFNIPVIAVTGSNGKTTTKEMIAAVLSAGYRVLKNEGTKNNNIGVPLALLGLGARHGAAVLELGTNHFGEIEYLAGLCRPNIGVITNIGYSHLEHFGDLKGVLKEKNTLLDHLQKPYLSVLNSDDALLKKQTAKAGAGRVVLSVGVKNKADFIGSCISSCAGRLKFLVNEKQEIVLRSPARHNVYNALFAVSIGRVLGIGYRRIAKQLSLFEFPSGRLRLVTRDNINFIDDTYNANPSSLKQALSTLEGIKIKGRKIVIMGDMLELGSSKEAHHRAAGTSVGRVCDLFISVGPLARLAALTAKEFLDPENIFKCDTAQGARDLLRRLSVGGDDLVLVKGSRAMKMEGVFTR